ncbi:MAG: alkaline phosphatase family protein [Terriglobia bacterium]
MKKAVVCVCTLLFLAVGTRAEESESPVPSSPRFLVICMDGLGYELAEEMYREGELKNFHPPAPVINAFPSLTNLGLVEILGPLGAPPARGYEDYYFDPQANRLRGGLLYRLSGDKFVESTYRSLFDYHPHEARMTLEYALPVLGPWLNGVVTLEGIKRAFAKSGQRFFLAYFDSSDLAAHLHGKWLLRHQLKQIDRLAGRLRADRNNPVEVILFSDHGNALRKLRRARLGRALRQAGFRPGAKLKNQNSVVLPDFGLVSAAVLYTQAGQEADVAQALRGAEGVDLTIYRSGEAVRILGLGGTARVERQEREGRVYFRYWAEQGDPLLLNPIAARLAQAALADRYGFVAEEDWLRATAEHVYPDPLRRLWAGFDGLVEQPASVIVSLGDGYYHGSIWLDLLAYMRATHGNLRRAQSRGVLLSTTAALFLPARGTFTGENLLSRIQQARTVEQITVVTS